jgi:regulator of sigma E protease
MDALLALSVTLKNLLLVVVGFSAIIFMHELGHFLAARWAGIRVLAFAIGFGPAIVSYRPGLGWRRGSSEREAYARRAAGQRPHPTEYRLNYLPLGGYVRMLGQEDGDPGAISDDPDSYQRCVPWKRMIVISAGVVMNLIVAAILFVVVFSKGLPVLPAAIGDVDPGRPAAKATATNAAALGLVGDAAHLRPGDRISVLNGETPNSFSDVTLAASMSSRGVPVTMTVDREGVTSPLQFAIIPEVNRLSGLLDIGLDAPRAGVIAKTGTPEDDERFAANLAKGGLPGVRPGMRLVRAGTFEASAGAALPAARYAEAFRTSKGQPVPLSFEDPKTAARVDLVVNPRPRFQDDLVPGRLDARVPVQHLLGLTPVMKVSEIADADAERTGLNAQDIFARVGAVEFPSMAQGFAEIQGHAGKELRLTVLRADAGTLTPVDLTVKVRRDGTIGFGAGSTAEGSTLVARAPAGFVALRDPTLGPAPAARTLDLPPGSRILSINDRPTETFADLRSALLAAVPADAPAATSVKIAYELPAPGSPRRDASWTLTPDDARRLHALGWQAPTSLAIFVPDEVILKASSPGDAIRLGLRETRRVMLQTYLTFARLFEGTVKVEHLQGPVGIAHVGTMIAERGLAWLLFFLALISVNLAVVNFLPLPIVDGGQFLMILYEQLRGRPLPMKVQEMVTIAGLVFLGAMFLLVTFNDVKRLVGF